MAGDTSAITTSNQTTYPADPTGSEPAGRENLLRRQYPYTTRIDANLLPISDGFGKELLGYTPEQAPFHREMTIFSCRLCNRSTACVNAGPRFPRNSRRPL